MIGGPSGVIGRMHDRMRALSQSAAPGKQLARDRKDVVEVSPAETAVVTGELRCRRHPQGIAEPRPGHQRLLVDTTDVGAALGSATSTVSE